MAFSIVRVSAVYFSVCIKIMDFLSKNIFIFS